MDDADADPPPGPLLDAIWNHQSLDDIRFIVLGDPSLPRRRWQGVLPLTWAVQGPPCRPGVVRYLVERCPEAVREWSTNEEESCRCLPIHWVCSRARRGVLLAVTDDDDQDDDDTIQVLVEAWPESLRERDSLGRFPLQEALNEGDIRFLHQAYPEAIDEPDKHGMLALHWAVREDYPLPYLQLLTELSPTSVRVKDNAGRIPLHFIASGTGVEATRHLVELWKDSVHQVDDSGCLPLHYAAAASSPPHRSPAAVLYLLGWARDTVRVRNNDGFLPLHVAVGGGGTDVSATRALVRAWPESVQEKTSDAHGGYLPLHIAASAGELEKLRFLVEECPESARERTVSGWLAVHLVLSCDQQTVILIQNVRNQFTTARVLLDAYPESIMEPTTTEGFLPIHVAASCGYGGYPYQDGAEEAQSLELEIFQFLVHLAPASVRVASNEALFPANYALSAGFCTLGTAQFLLERFPGAIRLRNSQRKNALQMGIERAGTRPETVQYLFHLRPEMVQERDDFGSTPLHVAVAQPRSQLHLELGAADNVWKIARFLMERRPQSLQERDHFGSLPLHVALASNDIDLHLATLLVGAYPASVGAPNAKGQLPLHVVVMRHGHKALPVVEFLVEQRPEALRVGDIGGALPIHAAVVGVEPSLPIVSYLVEQRPEMLQERDYGGSLPIHRAVSRREPSLPIVSYLVEQRPQTLQDGDNRGSLPIHVALARRDPSLPIVKYLVEQRPETLQVGDKGGYLPVHFAVSCINPSLPLVMFLINKRPQTLLVADSLGSLPLHAAVARGRTCPLELVHRLVKECPDSVWHKDLNGFVPLMVAAAAYTSDDGPLDLLFFLATQCPKAIYESRCDKDGQSSLSPIKRLRTE